MEKNYYCGGEWFSTYDEACTYANELLKNSFIYKAVFTKAEMDSKIDHEMECGK